jgi:hypothetical protein
VFALDDKLVPANGLSIKCPKCAAPFSFHAPKPGEAGKLVAGVAVGSAAALKRNSSPGIPRANPLDLVEESSLADNSDTVAEMQPISMSAEADKGSAQ